MTEKGKKQASTRTPTEPKPPKNQKTVVSEIRKKVEDKLAKDVQKASLGDYIKLVALEKELDETTTTPEMTVTWVEESEK